MNHGFIWIILALAAFASVFGGGFAARYFKLPYWKGVVLLGAASAAFAAVAALMDEPNPAIGWLLFLATAGIVGRYLLHLTFGEILRVVLGAMLLVLAVMVGYRLLFAGAFA